MLTRPLFVLQLQATAATTGGTHQIKKVCDDKESSQTFYL